MPSIYAYRKVSDQYASHEARLPDGGVELATVDGLTYVSLPAGQTLPDVQPAGIVAAPVTLTDELRTLIRAHSPHVQLISQRVIEQIRSQYTPDDEMYLARIGTGAALGVYELEPGERKELQRYQAHVEWCRQWGREQRSALGL